VVRHHHQTAGSQEGHGKCRRAQFLDGEGTALQADGIHGGSGRVAQPGGELGKKSGDAELVFAVQQVHRRGTASHA